MDLNGCISRLESSAAAFPAILGGTTPEQARWKPSADEWSLLEVINHLADEEVEDFRTRLRLTIDEPGRDWPPIDPGRWVTERQYNARELSESLGRFVRERQETLRWLRGATALDLESAKVHPQFGSMRAGDLLHAWCAHDLLHIRQMNRLQYQFLVQQKGDFFVEYAGEWITEEKDR
jgi:hypothetical protein